MLKLSGLLATSALAAVVHLGGGVTAVFTEATGRVSTMEVAHENAPWLSDPDIPASEEGSADGNVRYFEFAETYLGRWDGRTRIVSDYIDIDGVDAAPVPFHVTSPTGGNPTAVNHVVGGGAAASGEIVWGTQLEVDPPGMGETRPVTLNIDGVEADWIVTREPAPEPGAFTFDTTSLAWNETRSRIHSGYRAVPGLPQGYHPFRVVSGDGAGNPVAESNVEGGTASAHGRLTHGTQLVADIPDPGESRTFTPMSPGTGPSREKPFRRGRTSR